MKLDVFNHIHPTSFIDQLEAFAPAYLIKAMRGITTLFGGQAASHCGLEFFGADHSVFATDYPFDPEEGAFVIRETIAVIDSLNCSAEDRRKIYEEVPKSLLA